MGKSLPIEMGNAKVGRRFLRGLGAVAMLLAVVGMLPAAPRVDADPNKDYRITPEVGPFVICAASYTGPNARTLASQLVLYLRQRDNLPAYYFDRGAEERRQQEEYLKTIRQNSDPDARIRKVRIEDQYAVLVGGYPDMDAGRRALTGLKKLKPPDLKLGPNQTTEAIIGDPETGRLWAMSPFAHAFVTRNPSIPREQQPQEKPDDSFLKELNAGEEYSLLQIKKPYSLAVKEYHGISITQPRTGASAFLDRIGLGRRSSDLLSASALQAHELCRVLRSAYNLEAYVLHTRRSSIVSVGGFDSPNDPELFRVQQQLAKVTPRPGQAPAPGATEVLQLFSPAIPMRVPRP
jgi:hypothetical protein